MVSSSVCCTVTLMRVCFSQAFLQHSVLRLVVGPQPPDPNGRKTIDVAKSCRSRSNGGRQPKHQGEDAEAEATQRSRSKNQTAEPIWVYAVFFFFEAGSLAEPGAWKKPLSKSLLRRRFSSAGDFSVSYFKKQSSSPLITSFLLTKTGRTITGVTTDAAKSGLP